MCGGGGGATGGRGGGALHRRIVSGAVAGPHPAVLLATGAMDIDGFGDVLVDQLVSKSVLQTVADLYRLSVDELMPLERMGKTLAAKLVRHVEGAKCSL